MSRYFPSPHDANTVFDGALEEEIHKEGRSRAWGADLRADETMYQRVYGKTRDELFGAYYEDTGMMLRRDIPCACRRCSRTPGLSSVIRRRGSTRVECRPGRSA